MRNEVRNIFMLACAAFFGITIFSTPVVADTVDYNVSINPSINLTIPTGDLVLNVDPTSQPFDSASTRILVSTNSSAGYQLIMTASGTDLIKTNDSTTVIPTLPDLAGGYTESTFVANKWGYKIGTGNYLPFATNTVIKETDTVADSDPTDFTVAAKVDFTQTEGTYSTVINFTAVANVAVTYMQDVTSSICTTDPMTVVDARDGEEYLIQELADGNCWMLDNLRLDPTAVSLETLKGNTNATDQILTYFKNGGGSTPYPANGVSTSWSSTPSNNHDVPLVETSYKYTVAPTTYGEGSGKIGVYYNYCAVSAGSHCYADRAGVGDAEYDVCPSGWRLPTGGNNPDPDNELYTLYIAYNSDQVTFKNAISIPFSGSFDSGRFWEQNDLGLVWSSTFGGPNFMKGVSVYPSRVSFDGAISNEYGIPARCLLK